MFHELEYFSKSSAICTDDFENKKEVDTMNYLEI